MTSPVAVRHTIRPAVLWFGVFAAPLFWSIQELVSYALIAHACYPRSVPLAAPASGRAETLAIAAGVIAFIVAAIGGVTALRIWRATRVKGEDGEETPRDVAEARTSFMGFAGLLLSTVFLLAIALNLGAIFLLPTCL
jgi:hypothetical protein